MDNTGLMRSSLALFAFLALCSACVGRSVEDQRPPAPPPAPPQVKPVPKPTVAGAHRTLPQPNSDGNDGLGPGTAEGGAVSTRFPAPMVSFTFDDGWANQDLAGAEIQAKGWHATYP